MRARQDIKILKRFKVKMFLLARHFRDATENRVRASRRAITLAIKHSPELEALVEKHASIFSSQRRKINCMRENKAFNAATLLIPVNLLGKLVI